ncbi:phosphatase PAP2 family protein [Pelodictyon luteolum]|uniref:Phosphoesterase, PA-phosphatase related protein n=1 Tax=Chlorobium luteolum (strain DSM 273 / BCRC 81028 / 2530) TaxID=319225 RepID=Q3B111_CHLL3|nr:Phosphoesterase, PA-phosphatase related protein [Pelodictyon luteolum DSM 273]
MLIEQADRWLFGVLNSRLANPSLDDLMVFLTSGKLSGHILALIVLFMLVQRGRNGLFPLLLALVAVGMSDYTASGVLKPLVERVRPCFALENVRLLIDQSHSWSFASSHAANMSAVATTVWIFFRRGPLIERVFTAITIAYAVLVAFSRIYVGVHYPGDVLAGMMIGALWASIAYLVFSWVMKNFVHRPCAEGGGHGAA